MSWKTAGKLVSGPPSGSASQQPHKRFRPNLGGLNAYQREREFASHYGRKDNEQEVQGRTDWDVLHENHRFIRDDEEPQDVSWEERLARAYESKLFKEFALVDLKHYKSHRFALRWRTAEEVVEGLGEDTCGSLRCKYHPTPSTSRKQVDFEGEGEGSRVKKIPTLRAFELPFVYMEAGERKEALVKVRLCKRCGAKLAWKPGKSDEEEEEEEEEERREGSKRRKDDRESSRRERKSRSRSRSPRRRDRHLV